MVADTATALTRVAEFLGIGSSPERIGQAVERSTAEQMRDLEGKNASASVTRNTRQDIPFVRAAGSGGWRRSLPPSCGAELETAWAPLMEWLGYELSPEKRRDCGTDRAGLDRSPPR